MRCDGIMRQELRFRHNDVDGNDKVERMEQIEVNRLPLLEHVLCCLDLFG